MRSIIVNCIFLNAVREWCTCYCVLYWMSTLYHVGVMLYVLYCLVYWVV